MKRQRNTAQMKEQIKTAEKELNKMEISSVTDAEFKTLVIRMFKVTLSEIKVYRGPTVEWMEPRIRSMIWNTQKKKIQSEQQEKKESPSPQKTKNQQKKNPTRIR